MTNGDKMEVKEDLQKLYILIGEEAEKIGNNVQIDRKKTLTCLKNIKKEIDKKYRETITLWKTSVKLYQDFLKKAPGSQQMNPPQAKPTRPASVDIVDGYIDMFESLCEDKVMLFTSFVETMYLNSVRGISDVRKKRDAMMCAVSGLAIDASWNE